MYIKNTESTTLEAEDSNYNKLKDMIVKELGWDGGWG